MQESNTNDHNTYSHPDSSIKCNWSRGLDESLGEEFGCNTAMRVEDKSCSGVSDNPSAEEMARGSIYENPVSGESSRNVSEQSPCSEESVTDSLASEEMRHFISKENSCNVPAQRKTDSSSRHLPSKSAISSDLIKLLSPYPKELERIQRNALWAEEEWRKSVGWPKFNNDTPDCAIIDREKSDS
jgi:hypothetical protein